ncbi:glycerophosphodiester phosphodiesterase family protein [Chryseobacterium sp.]|uniref:glycerophosphodiester phosphodiesterase family protein n=1 Tax=Chryseobacterium sp. TaxID=1871047 RepID=UPI0025B97452|nr:glycerophosphodiester phosphodiesterase family protein [Chryseobacterium sp.]MBV8327305.1 glycerophosphodiester phosphodiesterase family protein [Chryseobacterium sp.]
MDLQTFFKERFLKGVLVLTFCIAVEHNIMAQQDNYTTSPYTREKRGITRPRLARLRETLLDAHKNPDYRFLALHRAAWTSGFPENSMAAIKRAIEVKDVDMIEIDLKTSSDGKVYLMHDSYLQRTTNFLDTHPNRYGTQTTPRGKGQAGDNFGTAEEVYSWNELKDLRLKNDENTYTNERIPLLKDVIEITKGKDVILQLDITDDATFGKAMKVVKDKDAFSFVMFKGIKTPVQFERFITQYQLSEEQKQELIFAPIVDVRSIPKHDETSPMTLYNDWEKWRKDHPLYKGIGGIYEIVFKTPKDDPDIFKVAKAIKSGGKRLSTFSSQPAHYKGHYIGNVNAGTNRFSDKPQEERRGDFDFILAPSGNQNTGVDGYIITDEVTTFLDYFPNRVIQ